LALAVAPDGLAQSRSAAARAWSPPRSNAALPLDAHVDTGEGVRTLREWLAGQPAVLGLWATWCGPCLVEKPAQAAMARRLAASGARTRILALQAYDDASLGVGRAVLRRFGADALVSARAMPDAEAALLRLLGESPVEQGRTSLPWHLLIDSSGRELGRALGLMRGADGGYTYFEDDATLEFLRQVV
jgi:thiol-disulfide isomerase/thioredoxin